jgi:hypothetical protein
VDDQGSETEVAALFAASSDKRQAEKRRGECAALKWLMANAKAFAEALGEHPADWAAMAEWLLREKGIASRSGGPVSSGTLRQYWYRVRKCLQAREDTDWVVTFGPKPAAPTPNRRAHALLQIDEIAHGVFVPEPSKETPARQDEPTAVNFSDFESVLRQLRGDYWRR